MSYSNHTTNYSLPLYVGTDKPTYLGDFNSAMGTIDAQMKTNADSASSADSKATQANTNIGTLSNLTTDEKNSLVGAINEIDLHADTIQNTANSASATANTAISTANSANAKATALESELNKLNLTVFKTYATNEITASGVTISGTPSLTLARDASGSTFKLYGTVNIANSTSSTGTLTISNTGITPDEAFNIICAGVYTLDTQFGLSSPRIQVNDNGTMNIVFSTVSTGKAGVVRLTPCLYFAKNFGDKPENL